MAIFPRDIIGLYLERDGLHYCCVRKGMLGLSLTRPGPDLEPQGLIEGSEYSCVRRFLEGISPGIRHEIYLVLPRGSFFVRDMTLPPMDLEEAWVSVENNLAVYCHLPLDQIYHDVLLTQREDSTINALVFYAQRNVIDRILDVFSESGKRHLLKWVGPFSMGIYSWLLIQDYSLPLKLILPPQDGSFELDVFSREGLLYSASWPESEGKGASQLVLAGLEERFEDVDGEVYFMGQDGVPGLPPPRDNKLKPLPLLVENPSVAAIAGALSRKRQVSLDGKPSKIRRLRPWHLLLPISIGVFFILVFFTRQTYKGYSAANEQVRLASGEVEKLQQKIAPLESRLEALESSRKFYKDIENYVKGRPDLYKVINEIAALVPEGTWFSHLLYERGSVTVRGTSKDALEVLKLLRKSEMFGQVKLVGSVSRDRFDNERFRIRIELEKGIVKGR